ncbi:hypothetical protein BTVI_98703 [Pitangus sulphuratus]|nr:hypothetical protein BTVI_98703 [Pitangus sulphuratus]
MGADFGASVGSLVSQTILASLMSHNKIIIFRRHVGDTSFYPFASTARLKFAQRTNGELHIGLSYNDNTCCNINIRV